MEHRTTPLIWLWRDKLRLLVAVETALAGAFVGSALISAMSNYKTTPDQGLFFLFGLASGAIGGLVFSGWFGRPGKSGLAFAVFASVLCPVLGGIAVGTFLAPGIGTLAGALLPLMLFFKPLSFALWLVCLVTIHFSTFIFRITFEN